MNKLAYLLAGLVLASCAMTPSTPPAAVSPALRAQFAPSGTLVAAVNYGNIVIAQKDPAGGDPRGVGADIARELARRLGVPIRYVTYDTAGKVADAVKQGAWDVAFLAVDPARATDIAFSAPYVQIEGTYMVRKESALTRIDQFDREGLQIAVGLKTAYDLFLTRELKKSVLVRSATSATAIEEFRTKNLGAVAGVKNPLVLYAAKEPTLRVIEGNFTVIGQAAGVPQGRPEAAKYLREVIEELKRSGFVARALQQSGVTDATVAPPAN